MFFDGGVRRGTDVYKALALGASGVGIGRPYAWGLAAFGQEGAERVLDILNHGAATCDGGMWRAIDQRDHREDHHRPRCRQRG